MSPTWSPDAQRIAFLSNRAEGWDLYVMDANGTNVERLTQGSTADDPAWSPDGAWIAVERDHRIEAVSADGSGRIELVRDARCAAWSPELRLAFVRNRDLYIREPSGAESLLVRDADQPHWSPDGETIAFVRRGIWTLNLKSGAMVQRTHNPADHSPAIAADGDIIFVRNAAITIIHPDDTIADSRHLPSPAGAPSPHPSNLDRIAFHIHDRGNWDIAVASLQHREVRQLTGATWTSWNARL